MRRRKEGKMRRRGGKRVREEWKDGRIKMGKREKGEMIGGRGGRLEEKNGNRRVKGGRIGIREEERVKDRKEGRE